MASACEGKVALVVGASQGGTGTGSAIRFAAEGAKVAVVARDEAKLAAVLAEIEAVGGEGVMFPCDLSDPDGGRDTLVARTAAALGPVDILVNVAAMGGYKAFEEFTEKDLRSALEVNLHAPWILCRDVLVGMRERGSGAIVNIGTKAAEPPVGPPYSEGVTTKAATVYGTTKAALHRFTRALAAETYGQGISVNVLSPVSAIGTPNLVAMGWLPDHMFEPVETMVESVLALATGDPAVLTGRDVYSLDLLLELQRPVYDFTGTTLVEGWQPADLPALIAEKRVPVPMNLGSYQDARTT